MCIVNGPKVYLRQRLSDGIRFVFHITEYSVLIKHFTGMVSLSSLYTILPGLVLSREENMQRKPVILVQQNDSNYCRTDILAQVFKNNGQAIVLRWVPCHSKILGNEKTDTDAKDVGHKGGKRTDHWSSLTHIKTELQKTRAAELLRWHQAKSQERKGTMQGFYIPNSKGQISPTLGKTSTKYAMRYYQHMVGHDALGTFLARIGVIETPECWWCGA